MAYRGNKTGSFSEIQNITSTYNPKIFKTKEERLEKKVARKKRKRVRKGLDSKPIEESTIQEIDPIKVETMKYLEESLMKKGPGMRYDVGLTTPKPPTGEPTSSVTTRPIIELQPIKVKTQKSPYKSKHLKTSFVSKLFGGSGSFRAKVRRTKDISGKRWGKR